MLFGLKTTETLLGIETKACVVAATWSLGLKTTETLLGIETLLWQKRKYSWVVSKLLKPF